MWPAIAAIAVPLIGVILGVFRGDTSNRLSRKIKHTAELADLLKENKPARQALDSLLVRQAEELNSRELARLQRHVNPANLTLAILLTIASGGGVYGLSVWTVAWWPGGFGWIPLVLLIVVGSFLLLITGAGFAQIFKPAKPRAARGGA